MGGSVVKLLHSAIDLAFAGTGAGLKLRVDVCDLVSMEGLVLLLKECAECLRFATETESLKAVEMHFLTFFLFSGILSSISKEVKSALWWKEELLKLEPIFSE